MRIKSFRKEKSKQFYFRIFDKNEKRILSSEEYNSKAARDNGIASFKKNSAISDMYERKVASDGRFFFNVKSPNGQVVATSAFFKTEDDRESVIQSILNYATGGTKTKASAPAANADSASKDQDDYMATAFYADSGTDTSSGYDKFQKGAADHYYFSFKSDDGKVLLVSQGYTAEAGRDNGIASVTKNAPIEKRYSTHSEGGKHYFTLKAGNHQEIARSADFGSEEDMKRAISILIAGKGSFAPPAMAKASSAASAESSDSKEQDDYMGLDFYQSSGTDTGSGFDKFHKGDAGLHYFSFKSDDGKVLLMSQGYTAEAGRDNGISSVEKNGKLEERYTAHSEDGKFFFTLKAGNHQEIAKSVNFDSQEDMARAINIIRSGGGSMAPVMAKASSASSSSADSGDSKEGQDEYMGLDFYRSNASGDGFNRFANDGSHYFTYNGGNDVILFSQAYTAEAGRDNGIASVTKNAPIEKRYGAHNENGKYYFTLKAGNHQEIGRSREYDSEADMKAAMGLMMAAGGGGAVASRSTSSSSGSSESSSSSSSSTESTSAEKVALASSGVAAGAVGGEMVKSSSKTTKTEKEDDYLPCKEYEGHTVNDKVNNVAFFKHENGQYYFVVYKENGGVRLRSEGFGSAKERDVELSGMLKNINNPDMYSSIKSGKYAIHVLKDATGREVGRSCLEKEEEAKPVLVKEAPVEAIAATAVAGAAATTVVTSETKKEKEDDYLPCKAYEGHNVNDKENGVAFFKHENGQYYFVVYKKDGSVRLRSEGFESAKERDVELSGMLKNLNKKDMYTTIKRGKYSIHILKDADGREVGRSCLEKEEAAAPVKTEPVAPVVVEETTTVVQEESSVETVAATAIAGAAAATVISSSSTESPEPPAPVDKEDDYLPCKEYEGHKISDKKNRVAFFKHENGQYYFAIYNPDGSVRLRSEGFRTVQERDSELSGAVKGLNNKDMYETLRKGKYFMNVLKDKTGREVGRSCLQKEETPVVPKEAVAATAVAAAVVAAPVVKEVVKNKKVEIEDDYLPCKAYRGHKVTDKKNNIAFFKHENGQHYFVVYKKNGGVKLRSEGFPSRKEMQGELNAVIKHMKTKRQYSKIEAQGGKYVIHVLKDEKGKEVGRSCLEKVKEAAPVIATAAAAAAVAATTIKKVETVEEVIEPAPVVKETAKKVVATAGAKAAVGGATAKAAATTAAAATGGGFKWWWLLPLLLLPLLFFWWKGCDTNTTAVVAPPVKEVVAEKPAPEPVKEVAPPPAPSCNCSGGSSSPVFNLPSNSIPKSLTRLGTSPEFGNSHNMSSSQFYNKLKGAASANGRDKQFLDQVFKAMGYGGFSDATADMFSEVRLSPGTTGNMGFGGSKHRTIYATINTSGKDLEAFKIKAANGCHLHFMKTCGNHFFFCPN